MVPKLRLTPKPPRIHGNANREGMRDRSEETNRVKYRPPSKPPYTVNVNRETTGSVEKQEDLIISKYSLEQFYYNKRKV